MIVKRKILFVNSSVSGGGAGKALIYLLKALRKDQVEPVVVMPYDGVIGEAVKKTGTKIHYVPWLPERFGKTQFQLPSVIRFKWLQRILNVVLMPYFAIQIARIARKEKVDVICSNHQYHVPICVLAGVLSGKPVVIYSREYLEGFWPKLCFRTLAKTNTVSKVFSVSRVSGELYQDMKKLEVLYDCYDFDEFGGNLPAPSLRNTFNLPKDAFVFGFMGRVIERKGVDFLIRSFQPVFQKYPNAYLAIVGGNDPGITHDLIGQYKELAQQLGISSRVIFTGFQKDVRGMTSDFDVFVMPSLNPEPFGLVYLEAVICRVPAMVPDNSGAAEVVDHGKNGYIFKAMNEESLAQSMCEAVENREKFRSMITKAYDDAYKGFDIKMRSENVTQAFLHSA